MGHGLNRLGEALAKAQDERLARVDLAAGRRQLLASAAQRPSNRRARAGLVAAIALAAAVLLYFTARPRPLSFAIGDGGRGRAEAWIAAGPSALPLRFSDGTVIALRPEARARVASIDARGARVVLEKGSLDASVVHRDGTRWSVDVGPFEVRVTGTRFDVGWSPEGEVFRLSLTEGSVVVTGPLLGEGRTVTAGETLEVRCRDQKLALAASAAPRAIEPTPAPPSPSIQAAPLPSIAVTSSSTARAPVAIEPPPRAGFRELAAAGKYAEAVEAAEEEGFASVCDRAGAADLMMLADAARFSGRAARAREALLALRRRFPGDPRAATAGFLLGRTAFEGGGGCAEASRWFTTYLAEQPVGPLAGEAAARLMECREQSGDRAGAREAARRYLRALPGGPRADRARRLLDDEGADGGAPMER